MKRANALSLLAVTALLVPTVAMAQIGPGMETSDRGTVTGAPAPAHFAGYATFDLTTGQTSYSMTKPTPLAAVDIYNNIGNAPIAGLASTDLASIFGDQVTTTGTGTLDELELVVYNAAGGPVMTTNIFISFYDAVTLAPLGSIGGGLDFTPLGGLPAGSFVYVQGTGLAGAGVNLSTTNLIVTQQLQPITSASTSLGTVLVSAPPALGTSLPSVYIDSSTFGPAGFYTLNGIDEADLGYRLAILEPTPAKQSTWGGVKGTYRGQ
ncbi:MAG TPA: hypothetical protein VKF80_00930 [Candidatus Eisenbacteria bacterium]|nr:hypothetical protein [Candidatus Eisenbacteria bacterium]